MGEIKTKAAVKNMRLEAKVIRANGTVEDHGVIAYYSANPFKQWVYNHLGKAL